MSPLIGIAVNLLPELAKRLTKNSSEATQEMVVSIVRDVLQTDDPDEAMRRSQDPKLSGELRLKLAEIENQAAALEHKAEQDARAAQLDRLRMEFQDIANQRESKFKTLEAGLTDVQDARQQMVALDKQESWLANGPVVVSTVVTLGFFATLIGLILLINSGFGTENDGERQVLQIINIAVGALTAAFATVVSFWLGSSQGSREKDDDALEFQKTTINAQSQAAQATQTLFSEQSRQTAAILERVSKQPPQAQQVAQPAVPARSKDARQFMKCVDLILVHEGGFADHPEDPGGATNLGITHKTLAAWRGAPVTKEDVRNLTRDEACEIYRANYWNALNCDNLPAGVDLVAFDFGVNAGVGRAGKLLQSIVHVEQDGQVGPITIGAAQSIDPGFIINAFSDGRLEHYRSLKHWETFKKGWTRRTSESRAAALAML